MTITGADHTSFTISDMTRTLAFYCDLLGFEIILERPHITSKYFRDIVGLPDGEIRGAVLRIPGTTHKLELYEYKHPRGIRQNLAPNNPGSSHVAYCVNDIQAIYLKLKEAGVEFISEPTYMDEGPNTGGWSLYMKDPDGIIVELFQKPPNR